MNLGTVRQGQAADLVKSQNLGMKARSQAETGHEGSTTFRAHAPGDHPTVKQDFCARSRTHGGMQEVHVG